MERKNKIRSLLLGSAIGDAVGVPYEFLRRHTFKCSDMVGYGTHNQPVGTWSDDTSMLLCLAEQIAEGFDLQKLADKFCDWYSKGYMTATGEVFDIGISTQRAIQNIRHRVEPVLCGGTGERDNGNGSLMRIAPLVFLTVSQSDCSRKYELVKNVSSITHAHNISVFSCYVFITYLELLLSGKDKRESYIELCNLFSEYSHHFKNILDGKLFERQEHEIESDGFVLNTLQSALWCFLTTDNYKDAILKAVNLGSDTDTTACVTGAMAGMYYGEENIPKEWLDKIAQKNMIISIAERMADKVQE